MARDHRRRWSRLRARHHDGNRTTEPVGRGRGCRWRVVPLKPTRRPAIPVSTPTSDLLSVDQIAERLERALSHSPADETELVWLEVNHGTASNRGQRIDDPVLCPSGQSWSASSTGAAWGAIAPGPASRVRSIPPCGWRSPSPAAVILYRDLPHLPANDNHLAETADLYDPELAELDADGARAMLARLRRRRETVWLNWSDARVAVFNSRGVRRQMAVTAATFETSLGRRPGGGRAASSSRTLQGLQPERIIERARSRHASGPVGDPPTESVSALLSPEATIQLLDILNRAAFSAISYYRGSSFLRQHLGCPGFRPRHPSARRRHRLEGSPISFRPGRNGQAPGRPHLQRITQNTGPRSAPGGAAWPTTNSPRDRRQRRPGGESLSAPR